MLIQQKVLQDKVQQFPGWLRRVADALPACSHQERHGCTSMGTFSDSDDGFYKVVGFPHRHVALGEGTVEWRRGAAPQPQSKLRERKTKMTKEEKEAVKAELTVNSADFQWDDGTLSVARDGNKETRPSNRLLSTQDAEESLSGPNMEKYNANNKKRKTYSHRRVCASRLSDRSITWDDETGSKDIYFSPQYSRFGHPWVCSSFETWVHNTECLISNNNNHLVSH